MQPVMTLALFAAEQLLKYAPGMFVSFQKLISKPGVTVEELKAERARIAAQTYESLVPHTQLPPVTQTAD